MLCNTFVVLFFREKTEKKKKKNGTGYTDLNIKSLISKLHIKIFIERKTRVGKAYAYEMLVIFKT